MLVDIYAVFLHNTSGLFLPFFFFFCGLLQQLLCIFQCYFLTAPNAPPADISGYNTSSTSIFVDWGDVPQPDRNGIIRSYTVTYTELEPNGTTKTQFVLAPSTQTTLTGLNEYTNYRITVFASTSKGRGNISEPIIVITDEDSKLILRSVAKCRGSWVVGRGRRSWVVDVGVGKCRG